MRRFGLFLLLLLSPVTPAVPGGGDDHDHGPSEITVEAQIPRLESAGSELELVATAEGRKLTLYLDRLDTNEPVTDAKIEISGEGIPSQLALSLGEGVFGIEADWVETPGAKALTFVVTADGATDLLNGTLEVGASAGEAAGAPARFGFLARPQLWIFGVLAVLLGFLLSFAFRPMRLPADDTGEVDEAEAAPPPRLSVVRRKRSQVGPAALIFCMLLSGAAVAGGDHDHAHDVPDTRLGGNVPHTFPDGDVFLPKPSQRLLRVRTTPVTQSETRPGTELVGTVIADPSSEGRVQAPMDGSIALANDKVLFVGETVKAGDLLALLAPTMPVYERGYLEQLAADVEGKLGIVEQRLHRLRNISDGYVAQREIDDTLTELEALREQKRVLAPKSQQKIELRAPVDGTISVSNVRPGQVVNTRDTLFEIVDPEKLWIEAVGLPGQDHVAIVAAHSILGDGRKVPLTYLGRSPALRNQARPIFFKIDAEPEAFAIGAAVKVVVQGGEALKGFAIPEAAVVRGAAGLPQIWQKVGAERFKPIPVTVVPLDGANVLVTAGLEADSRVVVEGAEFINQVR